MSEKLNNMSRRDWFTGMALSGFCANPNCAPNRLEDFMKLAEDACLAAAAIIEERALDEEDD
jgi:hypothetical protein